MNNNIGYTTEMIGGMPVVVAPAEIDIATADDLGTALLAATANGHTVIVVDMTGTRFRDSAGLRVLTAAHRRAVADGGELRLIARLRPAPPGCRRPPRTPATRPGSVSARAKPGQATRIVLWR